MSIADTKVLLYDLIEHSDDKLINILYTLGLEYNNQHHQFSAGDFADLEERRRKHLNGESKSYTWDEVKERLKNKLNNAL